jgi:hypothetical protein
LRELQAFLERREVSQMYENKSISSGNALAAATNAKVDPSTVQHTEVKSNLRDKSAKVSGTRMKEGTSGKLFIYFK